MITLLESNLSILGNLIQLEVPQFVGINTPNAILMNSDDYGYAAFAIGKRCSSFYEKNLSLIPSKLNRILVISQHIVMMKEILYPATRFPNILN